MVTQTLVGGDTQTSTIRHDPATGQVVVRSGRLELVVETKDWLNPRSLRDLQSGRIYADADYIWQGIERPRLEQAPIAAGDGHRIDFIARSGGLLIELTLTTPQPDVITETVRIRNPGSNVVDTAAFACGFAKRVHDGKDWIADVAQSRFCDVPYRYRPETGEICEYTPAELASKESWYNISITAANVAGQNLQRRKADAWGAEGWVWYDQGNSLLLAKYNPDALEWSLLRIEPEAGRSGRIVRFGGVGRWRLGDPEGGARLAAGSSFTFGITRYEVVDGTWPAGYAAFRRFTEGMGHRVPERYAPLVHWNELYDNPFWWNGNWNSQAHRNKFYQKRHMQEEAEKAKEFGCETLYLDPGWDTSFGSCLWAEDRLGTQKSFVAWLREKYGLSLALHTPLAPWNDPAAYPVVCCASPRYIAVRNERMLALCRDGAGFLMYDGSWFQPCSDASHGHGVPLTRQEHVDGILQMAQAVHAEFPGVVIEQHDPITGPSPARYTPTYFMHGKPGAFDELWGLEFMWHPIEDIVKGRAKALYTLNLAYSIPVYLHIDLRKDNANALTFWWFASTCRHLGVGGKSSPPVWEAQKRAMKMYMANKRFFTQGVFYGLDETIHAHTLPDIHESVINVFNLDEKPVQKTIRFRLAEIGLGSPAVGQSRDVELNADVNIPARGHQLLRVSAKPGESPQVSPVAPMAVMATTNATYKVAFLDVASNPTRRENLAYVGNGAKAATASSSIPGFAQHKPEGLNDGQYGNASGWICAPEDAAPSFQIDLGKEVKVGAVALGRDRRGEYSDRILKKLTISVSKDAKEWQEVFSIPDLSAVDGYSPTLTAVISFKETTCRYIKVDVNNGTCIDEFEVFTAAPKDAAGSPRIPL